MEYTPENLAKAIGVIRSHLTPDLLPKMWVDRNATNPMFGHCHTASVALYRIFGSEIVKLFRAKDDEGIWHWWCVIDGMLIDVTVDQYLSEGRIPPYEHGDRAFPLGYDYRKRVNTLLERVLPELG